MSVATEVTSAPAAALSLAKNRTVLFVFIALVVLLLVVAYEVRNPGKLREKVAKLPLIGKAVTQPSAAG